MRLKRLAIAVPLAAFTAIPAHAADKLMFGAPPGWAVPKPLPSAPPASANLPVEILRLDTQTHVEGSTQTTYTQLALKILTSQGLQAGDLNLTWDPATQTLTVNKVLIHRGDTTIDVLGQGQTFTILRREQDLEQSTLTGTLTANLFPEGLQVGDVLEVDTTRSETNPVTGTHAEQLFGPFNIPAGRISLSLEWPKGKAIRLAETADLPQWQRGQRDELETASMSLENASPLVPPRGAPARFGVVRMAEATDYASWAQVADIFVPLYKKASQIPADGPLRAELENIRASSKDTVKRAEAALQLVEERIRYVALEMGAGGLVPADAAQTWSRRFGDCKAKTALLLGLLHELGIDAVPVVANTKIGDAVNDRLPAVGLFNHILVRATIGGKVYWLDGTRTGDTSLARLTVPDFGWGLPIEASSALVHIEPPPLDQPNDDLAIELYATKGIRAPVPARIEETMRGDLALGFDQGLIALAGAARDQALRQYWRGGFDFIEPEKYDFNFDQATGELHLTMQGTATMEWNDGWYETDRTGVGYRADFSRAPGPDHDAPFAVDYPIFDHTRETILLPPGFTGKVSSDKTDIDETIGGFEYRRKATLTGNKFVVERSARSLVPEIPFKDATVTVQNRLRDLAEDGVYLRIPTGYRPTSADLGVLATATSDDPAELVSQGETLEDGGRYADALPKFVHATELDPKNAAAWADRAFANTQLGHLDDAESANKQAAALDPKNVVMLNTRGVLAEKHHQFQAALADFEAVLKLYPDNTFAASHRIMALTDVGRTGEALAAVDASISKDPTQTDNYSMKAFLLMKQGDRAGAEKAIDSLVAANPGIDAAMSLAIELYTDFGFAEKARAVAQTAPAGQPTALSLYYKARVRDPADTDGKLADLDKALQLDPRLAPALLMRAELRDSLGQREQALTDVDAALSVSPAFSDAVHERVSLLASLGRRQEALDQIDKAIAASPQDLGLYLQKANLLHEAGRKADALKVAADMVAVATDQSYAHVAAAKIFDAYGERTQALAEIDRALAIKPEAYIYVNRAQVLAPDDLDGQMSDVDKALKLEPAMPEALTLKANLLVRKGDSAGAVDIYSKMLKEDSKNPFYLDERGIALWREGKRNEAQRDFAAEQTLATSVEQLNGVCYQKAVAGVALELALDQCDKSLRLEPGSAHIIDSRATVYLQMGRYKDAETDFDSALEKSPQLLTSLVGRAIARVHLGDLAGARADVAAARKIDTDAVERIQAMGIAVPPELTKQ